MATHEYIDDWEGWQEEDDDPYCVYCEAYVSHDHDIRGCPVKWRCRFPDQCCMASFNHTSDECYTDEMMEVYYRLEERFRFWAKHPKLKQLNDWWKKIRKHLPYADWCPNCFEPKFWVTYDPEPCFSCVWENVKGYLNGGHMWNEDDDVPF